MARRALAYRIFRAAVVTGILLLVVLAAA